MIERLKCCWYILTMRNFYLSCYASDMIEKRADGWMNYPKPNSIKGYYHIDDTVFYNNTNGVENTITLRELICDNMIHVIEKIKNQQV